MPAAFAARTGCLFIEASAKAFNDVVARIIDMPSLWREEKSKSSPKSAAGAASGCANITGASRSRAGESMLGNIDLSPVKEDTLGGTLFLLPTIPCLLASRSNILIIPPHLATTSALLSSSSKMVLITGACSYGFVYFNVTEGVMVFSYGFNEVSGNFQQHNFGRGGAEGDAAIVDAQDGSGFNNANSMTLPDGPNGRCRMYYGMR